MNVFFSCRCINGVLKNKPRILVTHQLQYLKAADKILILQQGKVLGLDTYDNLAKSGIDFASLLEDVDEDEVNNQNRNSASMCCSITELPLTLVSEDGHLDVSRSLDVGLLSRSLDKHYTPSPLASLQEEKEGLMHDTKSVGHIPHTVDKKDGTIVKFRGMKKRVGGLHHYMLTPKTEKDMQAGDVSAVKSMEALDCNITGSLMSLKEPNDDDDDEVRTCACGFIYTYTSKRLVLQTV